ncbi:MAG: hypothetical protein AAGA54_01730 [Myxococcota bacterium]
MVLLGLGLALGGCEEAPAARPTGANDPIVQMEPPKPDDGAGTAPGCDGVTEAGTCSANAALYCDLQRGTLSRVDCAALGQDCVVDSRRGATCITAPQNIPDGGICAENIAFWSQDGILRRWDCSAEAAACQVDGCSAGAFCCTGDGTADDPGCCNPADPTCTNPCPDGTDPELPPGEDPPEIPDDVDCDAIGYEGICTADGDVLYCSGDSPVSYGCYNGETCQVDTCAAGIAQCCNGGSGDDPPDGPPDDGPDPECPALGFEGECSSNTLRYCDSDDQLIEFECTGDSMCNPDCGGGFGACCDSGDDPTTFTCADVNGLAGICNANTLYYCLDDEVIEQDCGAESSTCEVDTCYVGGAGCC